MKANDAVASFDRTAATYDRARRQLVPCFDRFYGTAVELVGARGEPARILELGTGTGLFAAMLAVAHPAAELVLLDASAEMLAQAEDRLGHDPRCTLVQQAFEAPLPEGPFDAVVSALAIHHLEDDAKRDLYRRAAATLAPGGVFVNAEQVAGATPWVSDYQQARWREEAFDAGVSEADMAASDDRRRSDRCAPVADQLAWLREAGLVDADVFFLDRWFAVLAAWRP